MSRAPETPIILWVCAAVCAHYMFAQGGGEVAKAHDDKSFIFQMGTHARGLVKSSEQSFEVALVDEAGNPIDEDDAPKPPKLESKKEAEKEKDKPPDPEKKPEPPKDEPKKKDEPKPTVKVVVKEPDPLKKLEVQPKMDKRIAVRQHVQPKQEDNPNARFVGDEANHVDQETVATQTSHDQDDKNPTPGGNHAGPQGKVGDSDKTRIAESEDHKGEKGRAPGEKGTEFDVQHDAKPIDKPMGPVAMNIPTPPANAQPRSGGDNRAPAPAPAPVPQPMTPGGAPPTTPEIAQGGDQAPSWTFNPIRPGAGEARNQPGPGQANKPLAQQPKASTKWLGLGAKAGPGQVNLNLNQQGVIAAVGMDQLRKEREADGERRRSEHRGSWQASGFEKWRNAIENYVSTVKPGNQTALNTAAVPFATYLNTIHNRVHPIFADSFLASLDSLPKTHPLSNPRMFTRLEIVVSKQGRVVKMGVVKTSGITAFDIAALDSVNRASPFGPAPTAIISPDGNVYLHWEFHRDEVYACSTMNARPFLLNLPAKPPEEPTPPPPGPGPSRERGAPPPANIHETREGALPPVKTGRAPG